jgi:pilus assembly protein FimV
MLAKSLRWALAGLVACPSAALALGLGDIHLLSTLNAPLDANIELVGATPDELASLRPQIASRETFAQHGLDWAPFLANVTVKAARTADGHDVLELRSTQPVTEPFLTVLVELDWDRGQFLREYDLLLDPPVYTPNQGEVAHAVAPPVSGSGVRQGTIERAAPAAAAVAAAPPSSSPAVSASPPAAAEGGAAASTSYEVHRGDTLSGIAAQLAGGSRADERRWMVAAYDGNPSAFDHNMNWLRAGAVLRIPSASAVDAISPSDALAEVHRQYAAWRNETAGGAGAAAQAGRLRLVVPSRSSASASAGAGAAGSSGQSVQALQGEVQSLQTQLDTARRLLDMRNAELNRLQAQLAARAGGAAAAAAPGAQAVQAQPPAQAPQAAPPAENPPVSATPPVAQQPVAARPPVARPPVKRPQAVSHPRPASPLSAWLDSLRNLWWVVALALVAALAYLGLRGWSSRRKAGFDDSLGRLAEAGASTQAGARDLSLTEPHLALKRESAFVVEESGTHERPRFEGAAHGPATRHVEADEAMTGETTALNLDQGDPLAEADFHMAYGLYDQAADLVRIGIQREPERRDLKLKLLEVFFVWGNKEQFLQTARELAATRAQAAPGEWEKIVIMGKQLAADDPLFAGGTAVSGAAAGGVDLDLEGGQHRVDFDILGEATPAPQDVVDLDIGTAIGERDPVAEAAAQQATDKNLALDDSLVLPEDATAERAGVTATQRMTGTAESGIGATREMTGTARQLTGNTREMTTTLDRDWNPTQLLPEAPTVEQPALRSDNNPTIREKVQMALRAGASSEHTTELALDDLGLDLNGLHEGTPGSPEGSSHDTVESGLGAPAEGPTLVAGLDEHSRRLIETAEQRAASDDADGELKITETGSWHFDNDPFAGENAGATAVRKGAPAASDQLADTSRLTTLRPSAGLDFEVGEPEETPKRTNGSAGGVDLDVGTATVPDAAFAATQRLQSEDLALPDLEPVTMSEVGTKLDLARAYMDMGDPEGARNILEEVLTEGSVAQKQEAERLIAALPG